MKATVVVDNIENDNVRGEWGLCIYIEHENANILLDTGASKLFSENANKIGLPLEKINYAVLSHAHYDHANGMSEFFEKNKSAKFYLRESTAENCYAKKWIFRKYIGIPKAILKNYSDRIVFASGDYKLCDGVYLIPHKTAGLEEIGRREMMYQRQGIKMVPDNFSHEQSLVFETGKGLVIFNSCSHGGAVNIINEVSSTFPDKKVYGIIGGFHLFNKPDKEIRELAEKIKETGIQYVCTGHCTKNRAYSILKEELGDIVHQFHVNMVMEFE